MHGKILPRELTPVYRRILTKVAPELEELRQLAKVRAPTNDKERIGILLQTTAKKAFQLLESEAKNFNNKKRSFWATKRGILQDHEREFGYLTEGGLKARANCAANSILQNIILEELGEASVGTFSLPNHIVPTVKIRGVIYVLDNNFLTRRRRALTVKEWIKEIKKASQDPSQPRNSFSKRVFEGERILQHAFRYQGGSSAGLAAIHANLGGFYRSGRWWNKPRNLKKAAMHFSEAIRLDPNRAISRISLGQILTKLGNTSEGVRHIKKAIELEPENPEVCQWAGNALNHAIGLPEGMELLKKAVELAPKSASAHSTLAYWLARSGRKEEAREHSEIARKLK